MYYLNSNTTFDSLEDLALAAASYLRDYLITESGDGEAPNFPESFSPWEEREGKFRLLIVPTAAEAECGIDQEAWEVTIRAYSGPANYATGRWELFMETITLNKNEIKEKIASNYGSSLGFGWDYMLIISPDATHKISAVEANRSWNPWNEGDLVAVLPAPYGDGSSALTELAEDMLRDLGSLDETRRKSEAEDIGLVEIAEKIDEWADYADNALDWYADEWLSALNGEANDLEIDAAFGGRETENGDWERIECPFRFEYK